MDEREFVEEQIEQARAYVRRQVDDLFAFTAGHWVTLKVMESPLERVFRIWFSAVGFSSMRDVNLLEQVEVTANGRRYRLDFVVCVQGETRRWKRTNIAVEVDGHTFHEKTLEQVRARNQKDRDLQADGWKVFHFSFSEFMASPERCCLEVFNEALTRLPQLPPGDEWEDPADAVAPSG